MASAPNVVREVFIEGVIDWVDFGIPDAADGIETVLGIYRMDLEVIFETLMGGAAISFSADRLRLHS